VDGRRWGYLRLLIVALITLALVIMERNYFTTEGSAPIGLFSLRSLRFWLLPLAALIGAFLLGANYIRDVYELPGMRLPVKYLLSSAFSIFSPRLEIREGKKQLKEDEVNLVDVIGGPGYVNVLPGSIALLEKLKLPSNVYAGGGHFVSRYERVKQTATLEDQHGKIESIPATTKDGIAVVVRDVQFRYRMRTGRKYGDYTQRSPDEPYPYSGQAMLSLTYNRQVGPEGISSWHDSVRAVIRGVIGDYIARHQLDMLTAPAIDQPSDPRKEIRSEFDLKQTRDRLRNLGAELLWVDIGHIDITPEQVDEQRVSTWRARWTGEAEVQRADAESQERAIIDLGRAEAQADMLMAILRTLENIEPGEDPARRVQTIILIRTAQLLEAIAEQNPLLIPPDVYLMGQGHKYLEDRGKKP
jgi:hypothetical protein